MKKAFPQSKPVIVVAHQARWKDEFEQLRIYLTSLLGECVLAIDHIGSTSIPGLAAKDIIDVQLTVKDINQCDALISKMVSAGFRERGGVRYDSIDGADIAEADLQKRYFREPEGKRRTHIHVREHGRLNHQYALLFRDYLRAHPHVRECYAVIKSRLATLFPDTIERYLYIKDPMMDMIFASAQAWAAHVGWHAASTDAD